VNVLLSAIFHVEHAAVVWLKPSLLEMYSIGL